jgi:glutamyl-tRNA synthetase
LRTALLAFAFAKTTEREFLIRVEDLDQQRIQAAPEIAAGQLRDLEMLGLVSEREVLYQAQRFDLYRGAASTLETYECFCSRAEIAAASQAPHGDYRPYPGTCANLSEAERAFRRKERRPAIRVRANGEKFTVFDRFAGLTTRTVDDFVLIRNDGVPAYNLAVVVDDGEQGVAQVVRGSDLLDSAPRQAWLASRLGYAIPEYVHVGLALEPNGERLAKRNHSTSLQGMLASGWTSAEVFALLSESAGFPPVTTAAQLICELGKDRELLNAPEIAAPWVVSAELLAR